MPIYQNVSNNPVMSTGSGHTGKGTPVFREPPTAWFRGDVTGLPPLINNTFSLKCLIGNEACLHCILQKEQICPTW